MSIDVEDFLTRKLQFRMGNAFGFNAVEGDDALKILAKCRGKVLVGKDVDEWGHISQAGEIIKTIIEKFIRAPSIIDQVIDEVREKRIYDNSLIGRATQEWDWLRHFSWSLYDEDFRKTVDEPPLGCSQCAGSLDEWLNECKNLVASVRKRESQLDYEYNKLNTMFDENKEKYGIKATPLQGWSRDAKEKDKGDDKINVI